MAGESRLGVRLGVLWTSMAPQKNRQRLWGEVLGGIDGGRVQMGCLVDVIGLENIDTGSGERLWEA